MGAAKFPSGIDAQSKNINNVADPATGTDAANKQYVDNFVNGLSFKDEVQVATTTSGTLATAFANGQSVDGVTLATGMRILLKDQTTAADRGIYVVQASGAPVRATDADTTAKLAQATVRVVQGTTNANTQWTQSATVTTVGTTAQTWAASGGGATYGVQTNAGLSKDGSNNFGIVLDSSPGLLLGAGGIKVDPAYTGLAKRYSADCAATTNPQTFTHSLGTSDVDVTIRNKSTGEIIYPQATVVDANSVSVDFGSAPTAAQWRVSIQG